MAPYKATHEERPARRLEMVRMRLAGKSYGQIGLKFGVSKNTARSIVVRALKEKSDATHAPLG